MTSQTFNDKIVALRGQMFRFARSILGSSEQAEDVVSELIERLWRDRAKLTTISNVSGYVIRATRNCALDHLRRERPSVSINSIELQSPQSSHESSKDTIDMVQMAISQLDDRHREVIHLKDIEGYDNGEIAEIMELKVDSVRMLLSRARAELRGEILKIMSYEK